MGMFIKKADQVLEGCHNWCQLLMRGLKTQLLPPGCSGESMECCKPFVSTQLGGDCILHNSLQVSTEKQCLVLRKSLRYALKANPGKCYLAQCSASGYANQQAQSRVSAQHVLLCPC